VKETEPMKLTKAQITRAETALRVAGHTNVEADGHLTKAEKKTVKAVLKARGVKAQSLNSKKARQSIQKMASDVGHYKPMVLGQKSVLTLQAEKRFAAKGEPHGKVDGILDKKTRASMKAEAKKAAQGDGFDGDAYNRQWDSAFPATQLGASTPDAGLDEFNREYQQGSLTTEQQPSTVAPGLDAYNRDYMQGGVTITNAFDTSLDEYNRDYMQGSLTPRLPNTFNGGVANGTGTSDSGDVVMPATGTK
jgi:hypothetical protein